MPKLLQHYLADQAQRRPDSRAVVLGGKELSYAELEAASSRLARLLVESGCSKGDRVAILAPKAPSSIVAMHAVLKADCAYVPIDAASPISRITRIVDAAEPRLVLVEGDIHGDGSGFENTMQLQGALADAASLDSGPIPSKAREDDIAHILFTSGSTGIPKGVPILHRNVTHFISWASMHFGLGSDDRLSGHSPHHFDLSTFDIFGALSVGAELHLVPAELNLLPPRLVAWIRESQLTQWFSVPSLMTLVAKFDAIDQGTLPELKRVIWCGEVLPPPTLSYWMEKLPTARFTNLYGPTEATIASSWYEVRKRPRSNTDFVPIGEACEGEELLVLNADIPVAPRVTGDLHIAGAGLSPGYWRDAAATAAAFISDPRPGREGERLYRTGDLAWFDDEGLYHFVGRRDSQIKSRGHRIELGEIEAALAGLHSLRESAVVGVLTGGFEGTAICCVFVPAAPDHASVQTIRRALQEAVPHYMLPTRWKELDRLPKNANGKIDRRTIADMFSEDVSPPSS